MIAARRPGMRGRWWTLAAMGALAAAWNGCIAPSAAVCEGVGDCATCTHAGSGCGWCAASDVCMAGDELGPSGEGACTSSEWAFSSCPSAPPSHDAGIAAAVDAAPEGSVTTYQPPVDPCEAPVDEDQCAQAGPECAWCTTLEQCVDEGSFCD